MRYYNSRAINFQSKFLIDKFGLNVYDFAVGYQVFDSKKVKKVPVFSGMYL